jgi:hypothetical protein
MQFLQLRELTLQSGNKNLVQVHYHLDSIPSQFSNMVANQITHLLSLNITALYLDLFGNLNNQLLRQNG